MPLSFGPTACHTAAGAHSAMHIPAERAAGEEETMDRMAVSTGIGSGSLVAKKAQVIGRLVDGSHFRLAAATTEGSRGPPAPRPA